jgi:hypothetical protein
MTEYDAVFSVHVGKTKGLSEVDWPAFDWQGFLKVESIMCAFAAECFSTYTYGYHRIFD